MFYQKTEKVKEPRPNQGKYPTTLSKLIILQK
jgi:hypothetical protein